MLIQLPSLIQLAQYRSKKTSFLSVYGLWLFFFFFAHFLINLDFISIGPQKSIKKRTKPILLKQRIASWFHIGMVKSPLRLKQINCFAPVFLKCVYGIWTRFNDSHYRNPAGRTKDIPSHSYSKIVYGTCSGWNERFFKSLGLFCKAILVCKSRYWQIWRNTEN